MKRLLTLSHFCLLVPRWQSGLLERDFAPAFGAGLQLLFFFLLNSLSAQNEGHLFFRDTVHEIRFKFSQPGYWDSLIANKPGEVFMKCNVTIDGIPFADAGVRFKGNSSYKNSSTKKPFKIDLEEFVPNQRFDGQDQFSLNNGFKDPTFLREKLMLDFCNNMGIPAPRATFARLYINDQFWGLYTVVEDISKTFLKQRFGNKSGNLFKGDPRGTLQWKGWDAALYKSDYELKTNEDIDDWSGLISFLNALNNSPSNQLADSLPQYLKLSSWFSYWAVHSLFSNLDSYIGSGHNYYLYQNKDSGKFEFITWDVNEAFGNFKMNLSQSQILNLGYDFIPQPPTGRPIMYRLIPITAYKFQLANRMCDLLQQFSNDKMDGRINQLAGLIRTHVYDDTRKFYTNAQFEQNLSQEISTGGVGQASFIIAGLKQFISVKRAALFSQLSAFGCSTTATTSLTKSVLIEVFPNPSSGMVRVRTEATTFSKLSVFDISGRLVGEFELSVLDDMQLLDLSTLPNGLYLMRFQNDNGQFRFNKVIVSR